MKIHEYQAKEILRQYNVPMPPNKFVTDVESAKSAGNEVGFPCVVKAQVHVGGRGKAGGIKLAQNLDELVEHTNKIFGMNIKGITVKKVLIEKAADIDKELYLGIVIDRARNLPVIMASPAGGIDIEEVAAKTPEKILIIPLKASIGLAPFIIKKIAYSLNIPKEGMKDFSLVAKGLYNAFIDKDCSLAEINPLVITKQNQILACDAKMNFDDNALSRHPEIEELRDESEEEPLETIARKKHVNYVKLDGEIGCIVNGAGLAMATMDLIKHFGGEPANFLDIGGGAKAEQVTEALKIVTSDKNVNTILFNIFGGIVRCDLVAEGILKALEILKLTIPIVIRLSGTNEDKAREMLKGTKLIPMLTMSDAAKKAVEISKSITQ